MEKDFKKKVIKPLCIYSLAFSMLLPSVASLADLDINLGGYVVVEAAGITAPKIDPVSIGATEVSGKGLIKSGQRKSKKAVCNIIVTVKDANDVVKETQTFTIQPTEKDPKGSVWKVTLTNPVQEGYKVYAKQELKGTTTETSEEVSVVVKQLLSKLYEGKLTMPTLEVWSEDVFVLEDDAVEDIINAFKEANNALPPVNSKTFGENLYKPTGKDDKKKPIDVSGDGKKITVTFSDGSKIENIDISQKVTVKQITENSKPAEVEKLTVVDGEIKGKISGKGPFNRARVTIVKFNNETSKKNYCESGKCTVDKNATELATIFVDETTGEFTYKVTDNKLLTLGKDIGITVKEYKKKNNCKTIQPSLVIPKVDVRDPKKLTDTEKETIRKKIREANKTANGTSKLPDGTGSNVGGTPAIIEISDDGKVKIISPNDVEVNDWDSDGNPIYPKNPDGTVVVSADKIIHFDKPEELLLNLAPDAPEVKVDGGNVIVTPNKADTDARKVEVTYTGKDGTSKTVTATKGKVGTWTTDDAEVKVDENGVVTLPTSKVKSNTTVKAKVTDDGGISQTDAEKKSSEDGSVVIKASVQTPTVTVDKTTGDVTVTPKDDDPDAKRLFITYTPAGSDTEKTVIANKGNDDKWSITGESDFEVSAYGKSFTIKNANAKGKTQVKAITKGEKDDLFSGTAEVTVPDKTAPQPPKVEVDIKTGKASITPPTDPDVKIIEVKYIGTDGQVKTAKAEKTGENKWKVTGEGASFNTAGCIFIPHANLKRASEITAIATDEDGNKSTEGIDTSLPPAPTAKENEGVITVTPPENIPAVNGMEITYTPDGSEETKTFKVVKGNDDKWKIDGDKTPDGVTVNENGTITIADGTAKEKTTVTAISSIDTEKKSLEKGEATVPESKAPEAPEVKVQEDGSVKITPKNKIETSVTVTYNKGDGTPVTVEAKKIGGKWKIETPTNGEIVDETSGVITIPEGKTNPGDRVKATATKGSKTSEEGKDLTKPAPPTVTPDQSTGNVTITPPAKGNVDGMIIKYKKTDDTEGTIKVKKGDAGTWTFEGENPDAEGVEVAGDTGVVTIKKGHAKEKTPVTADSTIETLQTPDKNQGEQPELVPDKTKPQPPTVNVEDNGSITITPPSDEDTTSVTVNYKDKDGNDKTAIATKDNSGWKMTKSENGETVDADSGVITIPKGNYKTEQPITAYGNDNVDNKSDDDNKTPVEVRFDLGNSSKSIEGKILAKGGSYVLPATLDKEYYPEGMLFEGWEINGVDQNAGASITINTDTVVKAKWKSQTQPNPGGDNPGTSPENPDNTPSNPPEVTENDNGTTIVPSPGTGKVVIPTTGKNGENPIDVVVEQDDKGKWENKNNVPGVTVDPDTGKTTIPADRKVDKDHIISESKPKVKPEEPSYEENEIPGIKIRDHYTPTFPVYVTVPKTEKVEKAEEVPVSLETHKAYIAGYEDNTLRAEGNLTRAEAAAMVTRLAGLDLSDTSMPAFKDMQKNAWYFRYINAAVKAKMLDADNGMMRPNDKITRAEFAKMLAAIDKENSSVSKFDDIKGHRYEKEINKIYGNNRIEGYEDGSFRPDAYLTRAESAAFLNRMFNRIADKEAYAGLEDKLAKFKDFDASKWYYDEMVEATNSHELTRRGKASDKFGRVYEKWTRILPSDVK